MALIIPIIIFLLSSIQSATAADANLTAYEVLQQYDFPVGLLPKGVTGYKLDASTGKFAVYLNESCTFTIESYTLKYSSTITGVIKKDKLSGLSGIQVKILIIWLSITEVTLDGDELYFSVGIASADFPLSNFVESPSCGCGFDCDGMDMRENLKISNLISSS